MKKNRIFIVCFSLIVFFATATRFYRLSYPKVYYFDEVYHAVTAKLMAHNDPRAFEWWNPAPEPNTAVDWLHPPFAKYTQALSMIMFGENSFGWRLSSAIFGILTVLATGLVAEVFFHKKSVTLLAMLLASLDGLLLAQSRIAMNDIHVTFCIVLTTALYGIYRQRVEQGKKAHLWLLAVGIGSGLAMGSKWSGIYILIAVWIGEIIRLALKRLHGTRIDIVHIIRMIVFLGVIPVLIYIASYTQMFLQGKTLICTGNQVQQGSCYCSQDSSLWVTALSTVLPSRKAEFEALEARGGCKRLISHFSELETQVLWYQTNLKATHPYQSVPWQWILDVRPVWQYVDYSKFNAGYTANIYNIGNPILYWLGLVIILSLSLLYCYQLIVRKKGIFNWRYGFLLMVYFIVWAPWFFSPRIMFFYHYAPAVPLLCILTAVTLVNLWNMDKRMRLVIIGIIVLIALAFIAIYPLNTGLLMPTSYTNFVFSVFPTWK